MDNSQLEQYIDAVRADLSHDISIAELRQQQQIDTAVATCAKTNDIRDWMHRFEECMGTTLRIFTSAVMEQIEQKTGVPFFGAEKLSEDIESLFLEQMK
jgi:hypothetical protein